jgi:long-chain acyl-CoA synthetase
MRRLVTIRMLSLHPACTHRVGNSAPWCSHTCSGKDARLKGFEFPKALHLEPHPFSIQQDLITPKMSLKRPQLAKHYKAQVRQLPGLR